jgi:dTMP kinase
MAPRGRFITFEGGEGAGKSTQIALLAERLRAEHDIDPVVTREPGGTPGAEAIRALLVEGDADRWDAMSEALLVFAARRDHVERVIRPALATGRWVLCDRFIDSTMAYQGIAGGLGRAAIEQLTALTIGGLRPDLTLILDLPVEIGLARTGDRDHAETRYEERSVSFHKLIRNALRQIVELHPERCRLVDAYKKKINNLSEEIHDIVKEYV